MSPSALAGRRVVVTRPAGQTTHMAALIRAAGGEPVLFPALEILDAEDMRPVLALIDREQAASTVAAATAGSQALEADARAATAQVRAAVADLDAARARADEAGRTLARARNLQREGLVPQTELDSSTAAADAGQAQVAAATAAVQAVNVGLVDVTEEEAQELEIGRNQCALGGR